jgi:uncharacterized protein
MRSSFDYTPYGRSAQDPVVFGGLAGGLHGRGGEDRGFQRRFVGIILHMPFEYDPRKSASNHAKHGIDFEQAQQIWDDEAYLEIPARNLDELRFLVIGKIAEKHWSAVITYRDENIRIISVRRSRDEEIELYEHESL